MHPAGPLRPRRVGGRSPPPRGTQPENHPRPAERRLSERESESESELPRTSRFSARQAHTNVSRRVKRASQNPFRALPLSVAGGALSLLGARAHARRSTRSRLHVTHSMHRSLARRVGRTRFGRSRAPKRGAKGCGWRMHASVHVRVALRCYIHLSHRDPPRIVGMPITRRTARGGGASAMECACGGSSCPYHRVPAAVTPGSARRPGGHHVR
jgi:hypothetical protein